MKTKIAIIVLQVIGITLCDAQDFANLDFEAGNLSAYGAGPALVPATNAIPGWTAYINGIAKTAIGYNFITLGDAAVSIQGPGSLELILQGQYTIFLQASFPSGAVVPAIAQMGTIPDSAQSLLFYTYEIQLLQVSFENQQIPLSVLGSTSTYAIYGGDISTFAGQTGQLLFQGNGSLDNIQFSSLPIPEPGAFGLLGLGVLLFLSHRRK